MMSNLFRALDRLLDRVIVLLCVLMLLIGVYSMLDELWLYENASDKSLLYFRPALDEILLPERRISEKQVAWLTVFDTDIDYPVFQGEDNYEYLNKNPYGEFSLSGSIFLDARNSLHFSDEYSLVYGHHMSNGAMFGALDKFLDKEYFDAHSRGSLSTLDAVYEISFFAVTYSDGADPCVFNPKGRMPSEILAFLQKNAILYQKPESGRSLIALSTCTGDATTKRLLVFGTLK